MDAYQKGWCIVNRVSGFGSGLKSAASNWCTGLSCRLCSAGNMVWSYNGGQGAKRLFLVLALPPCLHESCKAGPTLLNFRCFIEQPDFRVSGLFCSWSIHKIPISHWSYLSILTGKQSFYTHSYYVPLQLICFAQFQSSMFIFWLHSVMLLGLSH